MQWSYCWAEVRTEENPTNVYISVYLSGRSILPAGLSDLPAYPFIHRSVGLSTYRLIARSICPSIYLSALSVELSVNQSIYLSTAIELLICLSIHLPVVLYYFPIYTQKLLLGVYYSVLHTATDLHTDKMYAWSWRCVSSYLRMPEDEGSGIKQVLFDVRGRSLLRPRSTWVP